MLNWTITELEIIDRKTRKMLQQYHAAHSQSDVTRLYIRRKKGGRGLIKSPIVWESGGGWVSFLGTNDDQCFLVNLSMLITILDVMQAKSVGISCCGLSSITKPLIEYSIIIEIFYQSRITFAKMQYAIYT